MHTFVAGIDDGVRIPWFGQVVGKRVCDTIGPVIKSGFPKNTEIYEVRVFEQASLSSVSVCATSTSTQWTVPRTFRGEVFRVYEETVQEVYVESRSEYIARGPGERKDPPSAHQPNSTGCRM